LAAKKKRVVDRKLVQEVCEKRDGVCLVGLIVRDGCEGELSVHHIKTRGSGGNDELSNLITVCLKHHDLCQKRKIDVDTQHAILTHFYGYDYEVCAKI
jgi:hypothetical protein